MHFAISLTHSGSAKERRVAEAVYLLCALTSAGCAILLLRAYAHRATSLLLWCGLGFVCFALNNTLLFVDLVLVPAVDLTIVRQIPAFVGILILLYGLIWDTR